MEFQFTQQQQIQSQLDVILAQVQTLQQQLNMFDAVKDEAGKAIELVKQTRARLEQLGLDKASLLDWGMKISNEAGVTYEIDLEAPSKLAALEIELVSLRNQLACEKAEVQLKARGDKNNEEDKGNLAWSLELENANQKISKLEDGVLRRQAMIDRLEKQVSTLEKNIQESFAVNEEIEASRDDWRQKYEQAIGQLNDVELHEPGERVEIGVLSQRLEAALKANQHLAGLIKNQNEGNVEIKVGANVKMLPPIDNNFKDFTDCKGKIVAIKYAVEIETNGNEEDNTCVKKRVSVGASEFVVEKETRDLVVEKKEDNYLSRTSLLQIKDIVNTVDGYGEVVAFNEDETIDVRLSTGVAQYKRQDLQHMPNANIVIPVAPTMNLSEFMSQNGIKNVTWEQTRDVCSKNKDNFRDLWLVAKGKKAKAFLETLHEKCAQYIKATGDKSDLEWLAGGQFAQKVEELLDEKAEVIELLEALQNNSSQEVAPTQYESFWAKYTTSSTALKQLTWIDIDDLVQGNDDKLKELLGAASTDVQKKAAQKLIDGHLAQLLHDYIQESQDYSDMEWITEPLLSQVEDLLSTSEAGEAEEITVDVTPTFEPGFKFLHNGEEWETKGFQDGWITAVNGAKVIESFHVDEIEL